MTEDPIQKTEKIFREAHDKAGRYTQPVLSRYPLLFSFLLVFSVAAIVHGFGLWSDQIPLFKNHPSVLILVGIIALFFTGTLYKSLERMK